MDILFRRPVNLSVAIVNHAHLHRKVWHRVNHSGAGMYVHIGKVALCLSSFWQPWLSTSSYMQTSFSHKGFHFIVVAEMCVAFQWKPFPLIIDFDHIHQPPVVYIMRLLCACQSDIKSRCQLHAKVVSKYTVVHIWNNCWKKCRFYLPPLIH